MKNLLIAILFFAPLAVIAAPEDVPNISVAFSPHRGATEAIVQLISEAKNTIEVAAYSFTSNDIAAALLKAQQRGVEVRLVLDKSNETARYTSATFFANQKVPMRIDRKYAIMHDKYMIIDDRTLETGSFNYTKAAETHNAENAIIIRDDPELAQRYKKDWTRLWDESKPYARRQQ